MLALPGAPAQALNDVLDLQELDLGILAVVCVCRAGHRAFQTIAQLALKIPHLGINRHLGLQHNEAPGVVVNLRERLVDAGNAFLDGFTLAGQLRAELRHLANGVLVQQFLEAGLKTRQIVSRQLAQQGAVLAGCSHRHIHLLRLQRVAGAKRAHGVNDFFDHAALPGVVGVNGFLQPVTHLALAVVTRLNGDDLQAQRLCLQCQQARHPTGGQSLAQQPLGLAAQGLGVGDFLFGFGTPVALLGQPLFGSGHLCIQRGQARSQGPQHV